MVTSHGDDPVHVLLVGAGRRSETGVLGRLANEDGVRVTVAETAGDALDRLAVTDSIECVVCEYALPDVDGLAFLKTVMASRPELPCILLSSVEDDEVASRAFAAGVTEFLPLRDSPGEEASRLVRLIEDAVSLARTRVDLVDVGNHVRIRLDSYPDPIAVVRGRSIVYANEAAIDLLGTTGETASDGHTPDEIPSGEDRSDDTANAGTRIDDRFERTSPDRIRSLVASIQAGERSVDRFEDTLVRPDGDPLPVDVTVTHVRWDGEPAAFFMFREVTEDRRRKNALRRFRQAVEQAGHAVYITDIDGTIEYVNPAFEAITGFSREDSIGRTPAILQSGEMDDGYYEDLWSTILDGEVWVEEVINRRKDGERYCAHQTIAPIRDEAGDIDGFVAIQTDVTERVELAHERSLYERIVERLDDPIMLQDRDGRFRLVNEAVCTHTDRSESALLGRDEFAFMDEKTAKAIDEKKRHVLETEQPLAYEVTPTFTESGETDVFDTLRYPYYDEHGELAGTIAICRNVTELKERERRLRQYERAVEGAYDLICATDGDDRFIFANRQYCTYHDVDRGEIVGANVEDVIGEHQLAEAREYIDRALDGETVQYRTVRQHPTRGPRTLDVRYYPLDDDGEIRGVVAIMRDVTEQAERERQLRVVDRVLRHNLRNDLTVIRGWAEQIRANASGAIESAAAEIIESADGLATTGSKSRDITDFLGESPQHDRVNVGRSTEGVADALRLEYPDARIEVRCPGAPIAIVTPRFETAIEELLTNAIVHHDREDPHVRLDVEADDETVRISVEDDGPGIPEMDRAVLETGRETDDLYHGSGLGLWLVYWIVNRSGGSIEVSDAEGRGSVVTIEVPRKTANSER